MATQPTPTWDKRGFPTTRHKKVDEGVPTSLRDIPGAPPAAGKKSTQEVAALALAEIPDAAIIFAVEVPRPDGSTRLHLDYVDTADIDDESIFDVSPQLEEAVSASWSPEDSGGWEKWNDNGTWGLGLRYRPGTPKVGEPIEFWYKFDSDDDDEPTYEARTYRTEGGGHVIEWNHIDDSEPISIELGTIEEVNAWYEKAGYSDFTP